MQHTIVIEIPDGADSDYAESLVTRRLEGLSIAVAKDPEGMNDYGQIRVLEYHHEKMTED